MPRQKGQMFVVTMVFLVGLMLIVQQILTQYGDIDLSASFRSDHFYFVENLEPMYSDALRLAGDCGSFAADLDEMESVLERQTLGAGIQVEILHELDCSVWDPAPSTPLTATIHVRGEGIDITRQLAVSRS